MSMDKLQKSWVHRSVAFAAVGKRVLILCPPESKAAFIACAREFTPITQVFTVLVQAVSEGVEFSPIRESMMLPECPPIYVCWIATIGNIPPLSPHDLRPGSIMNYDGDPPIRLTEDRSKMGQCWWTRRNL